MSTASATQNASPGTSKKFPFTSATSFLGAFVVTLDAVIVNVALPAMGRELGGDITGLQWVVDGYTLAFAALLLSAGALVDRLGARHAYGVGLILFVVASAACGFAPDMGYLIAARIVQGAGAALIMPASLALIRQAYPVAAERARAIGFWAVGAAVASAAGPVLGGFLTLATWRAIFWINLPVGVVALVLLARTTHSPRHAVPFDWAGQATGVVGLGTLTFGIIEGGAAGFDTPAVIASLVTAVISLPLFFVIQARGKHPMLPLDLFRSRSVAVAVGGGFSFTVGFYGMVFLISLYLQQARGLSAVETGLIFLPMTVVGAFMNVAAARIAVRLGPQKTIAASLTLMATALVILSLAAEASPLVIAGIMIVVTIGGAIGVPTMTALILDGVPAERAGTASGALNTSRQVGAALAVAVFGALVGHGSDFLGGMRMGLVIAAVVLLTAATAAVALRGEARG